MALLLYKQSGKGLQGKIAAAFTTKLAKASQKALPLTKSAEIIPTFSPDKM